MVKIHIVCVGKIKEKYFAEAAAEYIKRLSRFAEVSVREIKEENFTNDPSPAEARKITELEGAGIEKELKGCVFCLAVEGKKISSEKFSEKLDKLIGGGAGEMTFVIGGSYGIAAAIKKRADELVSFSDMTFPHTLARVMLLEQLYRAFMISSGAKYHK